MRAVRHYDLQRSGYTSCSEVAANESMLTE